MLHDVCCHSGPCSMHWTSSSAPRSRGRATEEGITLLEEAVHRWLHLVYMPVPLRVGCRQGQRDIFLARHIEAWFKEVLSVAPLSQKSIGIDTWHCVLVDLEFVFLAIPGYQRLFSQIQEYLSNVNVKHVILTKGVHQALAYLYWLAEDTGPCLT